MATTASFSPQGSTTQQWPILASGPCNWTIKEGTAPTIEQFQVTPTTANAMWEHAKSQKAFTLTFSCENGGTVRFEYLYMIGRAPGPNEHVKSVAMADRRWFWSYAWMGPRRFNWRRRIGVKRPEEFNAEPTLATPVQPDVLYAPWSLMQKPDPHPVLPPPQPENLTEGVWKGKDLMNEIFNLVLQIEENHTGNLPDVIWYEDPKNALPLENVVIDSAGDDAISSGMQYLPGFAVYVTSEGDVAVKDKTLGEKWLAENNQLSGYEKVGKGHAELIDNALVRPKRIHVLFTREVEVRFDFWEKDSSKVAPGNVLAASVGGAQLEQSKARMMYNVLPVPDWVLPGVHPPKVMGTWVTFDEALLAWNNSAKPDGGPLTGVEIDLDYPLIRRAMVPFIDLWAGFRLLGLYHPDNDWMGRIGAIQAHWRRTFMINQTWLSRIQQMKSYRQACVDPENGARSPALILSNHTRLASQKSLRIDQINKVTGGWDGQINLAMPVHSYPASASDTIGVLPPCLGGASTQFPISEKPYKPGGKYGIVHAPATLQIEDSDQGILSIDFKADEYRTYEQVLPGLVRLELAHGGGISEGKAMPTEDTGPTGDPTILSKPIAFNMMSVGQWETEIPALSPEHKVAVIFTCIPASSCHNVDSTDPNNPIVNQQLEDVTISANDSRLHTMVSKEVKESLSDARGPDMYIRISAANEVARIEWRDSQYEEIEKIFGFRDGKPKTDGLILNRDYPEIAEYGASLNRISLSAAAKIYSSLINRYQGEKTTTFKPDVWPAGWVNQVTHSVTSNGEASTRIDFPEDIPQLDLISYLDSGTRELLLKLARPGE